MSTYFRKMQRARRAGEGEQGFTLIEILIVLVIIGILSGIVVFGLARFRQDTEATACHADLKAVTTASDAFAAKYNRYPHWIGELVHYQYLKEYPKSGSYTFDMWGRTVTRDPACP